MQQGDGGLSGKNGGKKNGSTEPDFVITRETPNQQSKNRVAYNYRTPTRCTEAINTRYREEMVLLSLLEFVVVVVGEGDSCVKKEESAAAE
jgi:hypothetical protein